MKRKQTIKFFRFGRKHQPFFRIGVAQGFRHPSSKYAQEFIGWYNPLNNESFFDIPKIEACLKLNIEMSDSVKSLFKKHSIIK
jgi:ribosomal protein S16